MQTEMPLTPELLHKMDACWRAANYLKEDSTITTPFDMTVLNDLDRFHLVMDTIDRLLQTGDRGI